MGNKLLYLVCFVLGICVCFSGCNSGLPSGVTETDTSGTVSQYFETESQTVMDPVLSNVDSPSQTEEGLTADFVLLSEVVPDAILEVRYYSTYNFVGERIDGYEEPVIIVTKETAAALAKVSAELKTQGYLLKVFDGYRPQRAVEHFVRWAADSDNQKMKSYFYPDVDKSSLIDQGYISSRSGHSRGSTVDLTLFNVETGKEVDMGGNYDFFGERSYYDYDKLTETQSFNRKVLRDAMEHHGFKSISNEWWHFTLKDEPFPSTYYNFPVNSTSVSGGQ